MFPQEKMPMIPAEEYPQRWARVQSMMEEAGLDLLVAYADDRATAGPAHARWLANFPVHFEPALVLMPRRGMPALLVGPESEQYALLAGRMPDVRVLRELTHPDEDYPYSHPQGLAEIIAGFVADMTAVRRVGLGGRGIMSADILHALESALPRVEFVDVEDALCGLRARKSPAEIEVIRYAYRIAEAGIQAGIAAVEAGVTEREVAAEVDIPAAPSVKIAAYICRKSRRCQLFWIWRLSLSATPREPSRSRIRRWNPPRRRNRGSPLSLWGRRCLLT